jgi:radical SAM protein (TIGR01212 family)
MPPMAADPRFRALAPWLRERFGQPVHRVALDAGSTCPNRDGTRGFGGCTYCDVEGSGTGALRTGSELAEQLSAGLERIARRSKRGEAVGAIAYLQSYTNTYGGTERVEELLGAVEPHLGERVRCVAVATRPDCLDDASLGLLRELGQRVPVWLELGLESASDQVLLDINRLHTLAEFEDSVARAHAAGLETIGHAILGLPGDGREGAHATATALRRAGCAGVKVHHLMVLRKTQMAHQWREGELAVLSPEEYVEWLADFVERLAPEQVLHRVTGEAPPEKLLAPLWEVHKTAVRERLTQTLQARGTRQGSRASA